MPEDKNQPAGPQIIPDRVSDADDAEPAAADKDDKDPNDEEAGSADSRRPDSF